MLQVSSLLQLSLVCTCICRAFEDYNKTAETAYSPQDTGKTDRQRPGALF
jgi:hypothetical protein